MSQEKVNRYKEEKANRKEILEKKKRKALWTRILCWAAAVLCVVGIGAGIGVSAHNAHQKYLDSLPDYNRTALIITDYAGVLAEADTETK